MCSSDLEQDMWDVYGAFTALCGLRLSGGRAAAPARGELRPVLPALVPELPFDHPANIGALMERDDFLCGYVHGLEFCVCCYRCQSEVR